jgi:DNA-binding CsgD family transcriptional regulator
MAHRPHQPPPQELTARQREVAELVQRYHAAAQELPSCGWLARRLSISRERARQHMDALRAKRWLDRLQ